MTSFDSLRGIILGIILTAVGWLLKDPESGIELLAEVGWIFFYGGLAVIGLSIFTAVKR